jgi:hypothetical protein
LKFAQFQKNKIVTTFFGHHNVFSPSSPPFQFSNPITPYTKNAKILETYFLLQSSPMSNGAHPKKQKIWDEIYK